MNQSIAPFWSALTSYRERSVIPFHTPGHKLQPGPFTSLEAVLGPGFFGVDPSDEVENLELNHDFETALEQAERLAAELFGAEHSLFLVNGTTGGLHYLLMPTQGKVVIPRFSHQAVYSALVLAEGHAVYLPASYDPEWLIPLPPEPQALENVFAQMKPEAVVLTHPTYYGTVSSLREICQAAARQGVLVFVDEAHGGHFQFSQELPPSALSCGADAVVQSTHKTLGSPTQTSMLHCTNSQWFEKVVQARQVLQTTSPSLIFLGALDEVRRVLAQEGTSLVGRAVELAQWCRRQLREIKGIELLPETLQADPTKIVFSLRSLGLTGIEVEWILRVDYNIQVELSDYYNVLALITLGDTPERVGKLVEAVANLAARRCHLGGAPLKRPAFKMPGLPPTVCTLREGFFQAKEEVPLSEAVGRVSGSFLTPYPPGVPVIVPGEAFTEEIVEHLKWCAAIRWPVRGILPGQKVVVLKENHRLCRKVT